MLAFRPGRTLDTLQVMPLRLTSRRIELVRVTTRAMLVSLATLVTSVRAATVLLLLLRVALAVRVISLRQNRSEQGEQTAGVIVARR